MILQYYGTFRALKIYWKVWNWSQSNVRFFMNHFPNENATQGKSNWRRGSFKKREALVRTASTNTRYLMVSNICRYSIVSCILCADVARSKFQRDDQRESEEDRDSRACRELDDGTPVLLSWRRRAGRKATRGNLSGTPSPRPEASFSCFLATFVSSPEWSRSFSSTRWVTRPRAAVTVTRISR